MLTYTAAQTRAAATLARKGATVTITRRAAGAYNPATGAAAVTTSTATAKGVILPFSQGLRKMAGTNIAIGDEQLLLAALAVDGTALAAPAVDDHATINGKLYTITEVTPLNPTGDTPLLYDCTARSAA